MSKGLLDIAGVGRSVQVRCTEITVTGISARGLASLLTRFPQLIEAMDGKGLDMSALADLGPDVLAAVIAAGTGAAGDAAAEAVADNLGLGEQLTLIEAIAAETFAGDSANFLKRLESLGASVGVEIGAEA